MATSLASSQIVVVMGAGPGLGQACCRAFASRGHPVALLSRSQQRLEQLSSQINEEVGDNQRTKPYSVDVTKIEDVERVFKSIERDWSDKASLHTTIFNVGGLFAIKPFLETSEEDLRRTFESQVIGALNISKTFISHLQATPSWSAWQKDAEQKTAVGNLFFTGATAAMRGSAKLATISTSSFALRSLTQSIAREYGPQGIHVNHFIIDGLIETERTKGMAGDNFAANSRLQPEDIAQVYYDVSQQRRSAWTSEMDLRPASEKF